VGGVVAEFPKGIEPGRNYIHSLKREIQSKTGKPLFAQKLILANRVVDFGESVHELVAQAGTDAPKLEFTLAQQGVNEENVVKVLHDFRMMEEGALRELDLNDAGRNIGMTILQNFRNAADFAEFLFFFCRYS